MIQDVSNWRDGFGEKASGNAEDFKQGAKVGEALECQEGTGAPCLKFRCAKPLHTASSYVF